MSDEVEMIVQKPSAFVPRTVLCAIAALVGCSAEKDSPPPARVETQRSPHATLPSADARATPGDPNPIEIFRAGKADAVPQFTQPVLAFVDHSEGLPQDGTWRGYPLLADFNADGLADLVASNREEDGYSTWEARKVGAWVRHIEGLPRDMMYGPALCADLDSDQVPDLLISAHKGALRLFKGDGKMGWKEGAGVENPALMLDIALGHVDGDAFLDCVGVGHFNGGISLYVGDGKGNLKRHAASNTMAPNDTFGQRIKLADFDQDGDDDVVAALNRGLMVLWTQRGETLSFESSTRGLPAPSIGNSLTGLAVARFDESRLPQIAVCAMADPGQDPAARNTIGVYAYDAEKKAWSAIDSGLPRHEVYRDLAAGDFDRDGHLDLLVLSLDSGGVIYLGDGHGAFRAKGRLDGVFGHGRVALGDIDGDGWLDVVIAIAGTKDHPDAGALRAFRNQAALWQAH